MAGLKRGLPVYELLWRRITTRLGGIGATRLRNSVGRYSDTLRSAVNFFVPPEQNRRHRVNIQIPHYWALYLNDGRGVVRPQDAKVLVWFQDPTDDPRTGNGRRFPVRARNRKKLSKEAYYAGLRENVRREHAGRSRRLADGNGAGPVSR